MYLTQYPLRFVLLFVGINIIPTAMERYTHVVRYYYSGILVHGARLGYTAPRIILWYGTSFVLSYLCLDM